ncbi:hypothetical protein [Trichodesmium erythraeum]|nr:hypothetical protein [Trichodesmium erythraeum 21-75]
MNPKQHREIPKIQMDGHVNSLIQQQIEQKPYILLCKLCESL